MSVCNAELFREVHPCFAPGLDYDRNLFDYEQNSQLPVLKGRLKAKLEYWYSINANKFVIDTIKFGYRIPFITTPSCAVFPNNKSALDNTFFVESAISEDPTGIFALGCYKESLLGSDAFNSPVLAVYRINATGTYA